MSRQKGRTDSFLSSPRIPPYSLTSLSSQSTPLIFEPDSVYVVFVSRGGEPRVGVFHHNSENKGVLAFADVEVPESQRSHCKVYSLKLKNSKACFSTRTCVPLTSTILRDRNRVYHRHHAQISNPTLPRVVAKRNLCLLRACRRKPVDLKRLTSSRQEVGTEEVGLDKPSGDGTVTIQEAREIVRSERSVLDPGLLSTGAGEWRGVVMMTGSGFSHRADRTLLYSL